MGVQVDGVKPRPPRLRLRELQQRPTEPGPATGGMDRDVVDQEPLVGDGEDDDSTMAPSCSATETWRSRMTAR